MATLSVRKLDDGLYQRLRIRAAIHGVSMEEEARQILAQAMAAPEQISKVFLKYFGDKNGVDLDILNHRKPHQPMDFDQ